MSPERLEKMRSFPAGVQGEQRWLEELPREHLRQALLWGDPPQQMVQAPQPHSWGQARGDLEGR